LQIQGDNRRRDETEERKQTAVRQLFIHKQKMEVAKKGTLNLDCTGRARRGGKRTISWFTLCHRQAPIPIKGRRNIGLQTAKKMDEELYTKKGATPEGKQGRHLERGVGHLKKKTEEMDRDGKNQEVRE